MDRASHDAHLSDDEAVAKMGHPDLWRGMAVRAVSIPPFLPLQRSWRGPRFLTPPAKLAGTPIRKSAKGGIRAFVAVRKIDGSRTHFTPLLIERDPYRQLSPHSVTGNGTMPTLP
jgi:hypothetical protein